MTANVTLTLIGGPTVLIEFCGFRLLTDPTFDPPGRYEAGAITLEKTRGPALAADAVGPVEAVLLSHDQHFDNLDRAGRAFLPKAGRVITTAEGAQRLGGNATGLAPWETTRLARDGGPSLLVTATPARHGPVGFEPMSGDVIGFALGRDAPGDAVYVTGDTVWYEGVAEVARRFRPRLVVLFAGGARPRGPFFVTLDNNGAVEAAHAFTQARVVGVHNDGWAHFSESQADLAKTFAALGLTKRLLLLAPGRAEQIAL